MRRVPPKIFPHIWWLSHAGVPWCLYLTIALLVLAPAVFSQEPEEVAPPPLKLISKEDKTLLSAEMQPKSRTNLALELMSARLSHAEQLDSKNDFVDMYRELGTFHAIMDDTLNFLYARNGDAVLKNFKKFEMGLRSFAPRLEVLRRDLPIQYEPYVKSLIKYVQDTREKAIEPFFGNTVVPNIKVQ